MCCPLPIIFWLLMTLPLGPLGSLQIIHSCPRMKGGLHLPPPPPGKGTGFSGEYKPQTLPHLHCCRAGWVAVAKLAGKGHREKVVLEPLLGFSFNVAKSMADTNHCQPH